MNDSRWLKRRSVVFALSAVLAIAPAAQAEESIGRTSGESLLAAERITNDLRFLSSDELEGRGVETNGIEVAADFIARRWQDLGLRTDLFEGGPFQRVDVEGAFQLGSDETNRLVLHGPGNAVQSLELKSQFIPVALGKNGTFDAPLVFVGYGITANDNRLDLKYDDYAGVDVQDKVVIVIRKEPQQKDPSSKFAGTQPSRYALFTTKEANAAAHRAAAILFVNDSVTVESNTTAGDVMPGLETTGDINSNSRVPTFFVRRDQIDPILRASAGKSLNDIEQEIDRDLIPRSFELPAWRATGQADINKVRLKSRNVIGMLPGEGELADEFVVIGAHYDHVGMGGLGSLAPGTREVHNGADDNGSGTVGLLEIARRLTTSLSGPRRSILFMAFTAEERGLLGSNYYVRHPRYPLEKTVAMINLDMVGRLNNDELTVYGTGTATGFDTLIDDINASYRFKIEKVPAGLGPSDHSSFYEQRIPVYHFFTGLHNDYHRPSDDFDKINVTGMVRITDMVSQVAMRIATTPERPTYQQVRGRANPTQQNARRPQPGRMGIEYSVQERGLIVDRVLAGSGAEKAGIQPGDRLVKIAGVAIDSTNVLLAQMNATRPGDKIAVEIERDGMLMALEVQL